MKKNFSAISVAIAFIVGIAVGALAYYAYNEIQMGPGQKAGRDFDKAGKTLTLK